MLYVCILKVKPVFLSGLKICTFLNPSDLEEVRHYRDPPDGVLKIMDAICLLFNCPPGWDNVKQLLGQSNFFQVCVKIFTLKKYFY